MPVTGPIPLPQGDGIDAFMNMLKSRQSLANARAQERNTNAQADRSQMLANLPFGGMQLSGPAGQVAGLEMIKARYGENSPQYTQAKNSFDLNQEGIKSRVGYQNILSGTAPKRFSTGLGKTVQELEDIKAGFLPGTKIPLSDEQKKYYEGQYGLNILKQTTDADTRKRNLFATNIEKTIDKIDRKALTSYSGIKGGLQLKADQIASGSGKTSPQYEAYSKAADTSSLLSKQLRQFYGASIQPEMDRQLSKLSNPSFWKRDPALAMKMFDNNVEVFRSEMKTSRDALRSPDVYSGQGSPATSATSATSATAPPSSDSSSGNEITIIDSNGKEHIIDSDKIEKARAVDPGLKVKNG